MPRLLACILIVFGTHAAAWAVGDDVESMRAELAALRAEVEQGDRELRQLAAAAQDKAIDQKLRDEVRSMIGGKVADDESRKNRAGMLRHWDGRFYLLSEDEQFRLNIGGWGQTRYVYNRARTTDGLDDHEGFEQRRTRLILSGHAFDPNLQYLVQFEGNGGGGKASLVHAWVAYNFADGWQVLGGESRIPFLREEMVSAQRQVAVERTYVNALFTSDRAVLAQASYSGEAWRIAAATHNGSYQRSADFEGHASDFAVAGRAEWLGAGKWTQFDDFAAWSADGPGLLAGVAIDYEEGRPGATDVPNVLKYTADVTAEYAGFTAFAAFVGRDVTSVNAPPLMEAAHQRGYIVQGSVFVIADKLDVFVRYEHIELGGLSFNGRSGSVAASPDNRLNIITAGGNWYFRQHDLKASLDVVWSLDALPLAATSQELLKTTAGDQVAVRAQLQYRF